MGESSVFSEKTRFEATWQFKWPEEGTRRAERWEKGDGGGGKSRESGWAKRVGRGEEIFTVYDARYAHPKNNKTIGVIFFILDSSFAFLFCKQHRIHGVLKSWVKSCAILAVLF